MDSLLRECLAERRARTMTLTRAIERREPDINVRRQRLDDAMRIAQVAVESAHRRIVSGVGGCVWRLKALDPYATLDRGYAIVQRGTEIISSTVQPRPGDSLDVRVKDGSFGAVVGAAGRIAPVRRRRRVTDAQAPLFTMPEERA